MLFQGKISVENHAVLTLLTFSFRLHTRLKMEEPCSSSSKPPRQALVWPNCLTCQWDLLFFKYVFLLSVKMTA